jgi:hypothetical protein
MAGRSQQHKAEEALRRRRLHRGNQPIEVHARTGAEPVPGQITGIGPTDTRDVIPSDAPKTPDR